MSEVKTAPVTAQHVPDKTAFFDMRLPGSFRINDPNERGTQQFWFVCPCGCGQAGMIIVGNGFKPPKNQTDTWEWNGSADKPTLKPSVWDKGHWHGWLTDGVWRSC